VVRSARNYPEFFDNPFAVSQFESDSILDVNPDDGEEITGIIPLFGTGTYGASQKAGVLVIFKERSIYVADIVSRTIQQLDTNSIGCPYPGSIARCLGGIAFANETGIFRLNQDMTTQFLSSKLGRKWTNVVNTDASYREEFVGHHFGRGRQYKVSFVYKGETASRGAWVYNYCKEEDRTGLLGGWSEHFSIDSVGWCNQQDAEFWASRRGRVFRIRDWGTREDLRDDASGIQASATFRAMDFGDSSIRKQCRHVAVGFRGDSAQDVTGTRLYSSTNLKTSDSQLDAPLIEDTTSRKLDYRRFSLPAGRFLHMQLRVANYLIDEPLDIVSLSYRVAGLSDERTREAK
jgi:hypothetical protein